MSTAPTRPAAQSHFLSLPDLAARSAGGAVLWANDDLFAEKENLIKPAPAEFRPATFGHKGQVYDGWETRRRRGADRRLVRLGDRPARRARHRARRRGRHRVVHRQLSAADLRRGGVRRGLSVDRGAGREDGRGRRSSSAPGQRRHPQPVQGRVAASAGRTCGCRCTPTAEWRGSACTARACSTRSSPRHDARSGGAGERRPNHRPAPTCSTAHPTTCCCRARRGRWVTAGRPRVAATPETTGCRCIWRARAC